MREILFRGKRADDGKWLEGLLARYNPAFEVANIVDEKILVPVHTKTVGQYTGLKDKNGKRIFEGDIVLAPMMIHTGEIRNEVGVVEYLKGAFSVNWINDKGRHFAGYLHDLEVVGNIHDNLELLEPESSEIERE